MATNVGRNMSKHVGPNTATNEGLGANRTVSLNTAMDVRLK